MGLYPALVGHDGEGLFQRHAFLEVEVAQFRDRDVGSTTVSLGLRVSNLGWAGYNPIVGGPGLEYPRGTGRYALFAGGIWLGAKLGGTTRVALAEYASEFGPGSMAGGTHNWGNGNGWQHQQPATGGTTTTSASTSHNWGSQAGASSRNSSGQIRTVSNTTPTPARSYGGGGATRSSGAHRY